MSAPPEVPAAAPRQPRPLRRPRGRRLRRRHRPRLRLFRSRRRSRLLRVGQQITCPGCSI